MYVVEGGDDRLDLLGVDDVVRQVVVDFGVGQVALLLAELDEVLQAGLAGLGVHGAGASVIAPSSSAFRQPGPMPCRSAPWEHPSRVFCLSHHHDP